MTELYDEQVDRVVDRALSRLYPRLKTLRDSILDEAIKIVDGSQRTLYPPAADDLPLGIDHPAHSNLLTWVEVSCDVGWFAPKWVRSFNEPGDITIEKMCAGSDSMNYIPGPFDSATYSVAQVQSRHPLAYYRAPDWPVFGPNRPLRIAFRARVPLQEPLRLRWTLYGEVRPEGEPFR